MMRNNESPWPGCFAALAVTLVVVLAAALGACDVNPKDANRTLQSYGFTDIRLGEHAWVSCGDGYLFGSHFTAQNAADAGVEGVVCCGYWKSCTVKF